MGRVHALEWEDLQWFPRVWRDYGTNYLQFIANKFDMYKLVMPIFKRGIEAGGGQEWVDCASGGGGGLLKVSKNLKKDYPNLKITLTDYYPNIDAFKRTQSIGGEERFRYETQSVNALDVPASLHGKFRTMLLSFHHFRPKDAQQILQNAVDTKSPIAIFEAQGRTFGSFIAMLFSILNVLILTPFIRPVNGWALLFIYIIPIIPLFIMWDGFASCLRTYSAKEMEDMIKKLNNSDSFDWEIGKERSGPAYVYYTLGTPKKG